jgi:hypothetical protein
MKLEKLRTLYDLRKAASVKEGSMIILKGNIIKCLLAKIGFSKELLLLIVLFL